MRYNELVWDKIPEIIKKKGAVPVTHLAGDEGYKRAVIYFSKSEATINDYIVVPNFKNLD